MQVRKTFTLVVLLAGSVLAVAHTSRDGKTTSPNQGVNPAPSATSPSSPPGASGQTSTGAQSTGGTGTAATPQSDQAGAVGSSKGEQRLYREVRHELVMLPNLSLWDNLAYKVDGYKVTLLGEVRNAALKSEAENAVKHIEGVEQVDNQIKVLPPSPADDRIRLAVAHSIFDAPGLFPYAMQSVPPIHILVENGHVTLEGVVNSEADRNMAEIRAKQVPGVFSVTNHLQVASTSAEKQ